MFYLYILDCIKMSKTSLGKHLFYIGITTDIKRRWLEHCNQIKSNYMRYNKIRPNTIVYLGYAGENRSEAMKYEKKIKKWSRKKKKEFIDEFKIINPSLYESMINLSRCRNF